MIFLRLADRLLGLLSMLVLARLLVPDDFGLTALAMAVIGALEVFGEFGFDLALIQNQEAKRRHYDTAWTMGVLRSLVVAAALLALAPYFADIFGDPRLTDILYFFALVPLFGGFINIGTVDFRKQLDFKKEFVFRFSSRLAGVATTIVLALMWRDYWALVTGTLITRGLSLGLSYALHGYRPRFSLAAWREIFHFSKWILLISLIAFTIKRAPTFAIGILLSPAAVGIFVLSYEIAGLVSQVVVAPVKRALFPGYAKLTGDMEALRKTFLDTFGLVVLVAAPATLGIGLTADLFVPLALGAKWMDTIAIIEILVFATLLSALRGHVRPMLMAMNLPNVSAYVSMINAAMLIPGIIFGVLTFGMLGAAWTLVISRCILLLVDYGIMNRLLGFSLASLWRKSWRSLAACGLLVLAVWLAKGSIPQSVDSEPLQQLLWIGIIVPFGVAAYVLGLLALWQACGRPPSSPETLVLSTLRRALSSRGGLYRGRTV